jgi:hypothetical protein
MERINEGSSGSGVATLPCCMSQNILRHMFACLLLFSVSWSLFVSSIVHARLYLKRGYILYSKILVAFKELENALLRHLPLAFSLRRGGRGHSDESF